MPGTAGVSQRSPAARAEVDRLRVALARTQRLLRAASAPVGLSPSELSVLATVCRCGPCRLSELAEAEAINPTMLSRVAGHLEELGLVVRSPDPGDRRAATVVATPEGRRMAQRIREQRSRALGRVLDRLAPAQVEALIGALPALEALAEALRETR